MLNIENLKVMYGGITAVNNISLEIPEGKIITLIGANGAGKSTTLRTIMGYNKPTGGSISYLGEEIGGMNSRQIVKKGITLVPEGRRVFTGLTVLENIKIGAYLRKDHASIQEDVEWVYSLFPILQQRSWQPAGTLSGGEQQMLAVARALLSRPKLLMMDEPSLGLAPLVVQEIFRIIGKLKDEGVTILLIEQNANLALKIADYGYVIETGRILLSGAGHELLGNEHVQEAYLGKKAESA
jgi:branched-chain amino acid transport system ATP-binding protein